MEMGMEVKNMSRLSGRWYKTRNGLKRRVIVFPRLLFFLLILFCGIYCFTLIDRNLKPTIIKIANARAHIVATEAINRALYEKVLYNTDYEDLVTIHKDAEQKATVMQANTIKISRIISEAHVAIKDTLKSLQDEDFSIPLGQVLGSPLLANYGPRIRVEIVPVGIVNVGFTDRFQEAGINQVRHIIYLNIETTIKIVVPLLKEDIIVKHQIPIAETIIIGDVPNTYLGLSRD